MTNTLTVCLLTISLFCCTSLSTARQIPKECAKGPKYWCETLKNAAACGAVGHCTTTVWEMEVTDVKSNIVSDKIVQRFSQLKDVKTMINEDYLSSSVSSSCRDAVAGASRLCLDNTERLAAYLMHVLQSDTSPQTMCKIIQMCNNPQLDEFISKKESEEPSKETPLLGASRCTWGPSYWCSNFSTGRECSATRHCAQRVWARRHYQDDNDSICKICKDMVGQARDQLLSNQTQEELKEVFEGECALIPIKVVRQECDHLVDDFVPELVETLSSQMDPAAVCSVAGLCNSERIDRLIEDYNATLELRKGCSNCRRSVGVVRKRFDETDYENFLVGLLKVCREMGSLSDSCSMLTFKYYENILAAVRKDFTPHDVCHLSGQCAHNYHEHDLYTFPDEIQDVKATDDVPCEFCEQVINHLRDTMVANTTEIEFQKILRGLCKQTGSFKSECLSLVEQYYGTIYNFLVSELNASAVCGFIGICSDRTDADIAPLLPSELEVKTIARSKALIGADEADSYTTHKPSKQENVQILGAVDAQLPIERMFVHAPPSLKDDNIVCSFCQYFLHYIQVELSDDNTEEAIKKVVENACDVLPESINNTCREFVSQYGPAVIALLVQEIDPASVCPALGLCAKTEEVRRVSITSDKSNCPLCLFAVEQLETVLKNNKSEASIRHALSGLCSHLSAKLQTQCVNFVNAYSDQLVEMLVADLNAQEICVYLKLCKDDSKHTDPLRISDQIDKYHDRPHLRGDRNNRRRPVLPRHMLEPGAGDIETNEIPDNTVNGRPVDVQGSACVICEFVLKEIDDSIKDKHNDDEIKKVVHNICKRMPKSVRSECDQFVEKYSDLVISLLAQELDPDEVCRELKLCKATGLKAVKEEILECAVCETLVMALEKILTNKKVDDSIIHIAEEACGLLPGKYNRRCTMLMEVYGAGLIKIIEQYGVRGACARAGLCAAREHGAGGVTIMGDSN